MGGDGRDYLDWAMVSWVYTHMSNLTKLYTLQMDTCSMLYVNYISVKVKKLSVENKTKQNL